MIQILCDLCGRELRLGCDAVYVVRIEVSAARDPAALSPEDLDDDHLEAISEVLQAEADLDPDVESPARKTLRFELCAECQKRYLKDPLSREILIKVEFSDN
ncbi:MAG: hypothetical protein C4297_03195 [Gemmataceae bacterium]